MQVRTSKEGGAVNIEYTTSGAELQKAHATDSGYDLSASSPVEILLPAGSFKLIDTGIHIGLPEGIEGQIRPRSGLAAKFGITVLNAPGTIDSGYRGEIKVILINHGKSDYTIKPGERVAQIVFAKVMDTQLIKVETIAKDDTARSEKGFGSSGSEKGFNPEKKEKKGSPRTK